MTDTRLMSIPDAAAYSGLSAHTLRRAIADGHLAAVDVGTGKLRHLRLTTAALDVYLVTLPRAARRA